jgi:hypothetical protein
MVMGRDVAVATDAAHRHENQTFLAAWEGVVITVGDHFRDDDTQRRHHIEIWDDGVAVADKRNAAVRRCLNLRKIEAQRS